MSSELTPHGVDPARVEQARAHGVTAEDAARLGSLLSLLADPVRLRILYALEPGRGAVRG